MNFSKGTRFDLLENRWIVLMTSHFFKDKMYLPTFTHIVEAYSKAGRLYHNIDHIYEMLSMFDTVRHLIEDPASMELAIFYHDYIYDVKSHSNEEDSAASIITDTDLSHSKVKKAMELIYATKHTPGTVYTGDDRWIVDLDLMRLGVHRDTYDIHRKNVRTEYGFVSDELYHHNRKVFLLEMINRDRIFNTMLMRQKFESRAVENISWEIKELSNENT